LLGTLTPALAVSIVISRRSERKALIVVASMFGAILPAVFFLIPTNTNHSAGYDSDLYVKVLEVFCGLMTPALAGALGALLVGGAMVSLENFLRFRRS